MGLPLPFQGILTSISPTQNLSNRALTTSSQAILREKISLLLEIEEKTRILNELLHLPLEEEMTEEMILLSTGTPRGNGQNPFAVLQTPAFP